MRYGVAYVQKSECDYATQERDRVEKNLHRRAKELGYELVKKPEGGPPIVEAPPAT